MCWCVGVLALLLSSWIYQFTSGASCLAAADESLQKKKVAINFKLAAQGGQEYFTDAGS